MEWTSHAGNWRIVGKLEFILWSLDSCLFFVLFLENDLRLSS